MATEVTTTIRFRIGGHPEMLACDATFTWHPADPLAIKASFCWDPADEPAEWTLSRELLLEGLTAVLNEGRGDVKVRSDAYQYVMALNGPDGRATVFMSRSKMQDFLSATTAAMPVDSGEEVERMDAWVDLALSGILEEGSNG